MKRVNATVPAKSLVATLLLSAGVVASASAGAATIVPSWFYQVNSGFNPTLTFPTVGVVGDNPGTLSGLPTRLRWGTGVPNPGDQSSLTLTDPVNGTVVTNDGFAPGSTLTHNNFPITGPTLQRTDLVTQLQLNPNSPPPPATQLVGPAPFHVLFSETANTNPNCPSTGGATSSSGTGCPDIFVLTNPQDLQQPFTYNGVNYLVTLTLNGLTTLNNAECASAGASAGCTGLITQENQANSFLAQFKITAAVPEPSTLALLGGAFLGFGTLRRRRQKPA